MDNEKHSLSKSLADALEKACHAIPNAAEIIEKVWRADGMEPDLKHIITHCGFWLDEPEPRRLKAALLLPMAEDALRLLTALRNKLATAAGNTATDTEGMTDEELAECVSIARPVAARVVASLDLDAWKNERGADSFMDAPVFYVAFSMGSLTREGEPTVYISAIAPLCEYREKSVSGFWYRSVSGTTPVIGVRLVDGEPVVTALDEWALAHGERAGDPVVDFIVANRDGDFVSVSEHVRVKKAVLRRSRGRKKRPAE